MRNLPILALLLCLVLAETGCGGGGSGGGSDGGSTPPPPPPVEVVDHYQGTVTTHTGVFAAQGDTGVEFNVTHLRLTFTTVLGEVVCYPTYNSGSWRTYVMIRGTEYLVWFHPKSSVLIVANMVNHDEARWTIVPVTGNG